MSRYDRTAIAPLLGRYFPEMAAATSEEWNVFLNDKTGLEVGFDEPNGSAFDKWRAALAEKHALPVWGIDANRVGEIKARVDVMMKAETDRKANLGKVLIDAATEAPDIPARALLK